MSTLDATTYEVVRARLDAIGADLGTATGALDARRRDLFGAQGLALAATHRIRTEHACVPRDIVYVGDRYILGYQVFLGLKSSIEVSDIFLELVEGGDGFTPLPKDRASWLADPAFVKDFREVFQYYKEAKLLHLRRGERLVLMVFQTGAKLSDIRVLRFAIEGQGDAESLRYLDNRGDRDYVFPASHDFTWTRTTRDLHVHGSHPHVNILDTVFVECINGDLTVKVENNTNTGKGVFAEPVDDATQGLDDAEIHFADLESCLLIKVRPYKEKETRYLVYNRLAKTVVRIDAIGRSCHQLPEGHGLIFPGGYWLTDGTAKSFPVDADGMEFKRVLRSPGGEDVAYIFYRRDLGTYLILVYNLIARACATPLACHSWCRRRDGRLVVLRAEAEPQRVHTVQVWESPFLNEEVAAARPLPDSPLARLGNRELVRAASDLGQIVRAVADRTPGRARYEDLLKRIARAQDAYHWLGEAEAGGLKATLAALRAASERVIDEYAKVEALTADADAKVAAAEAAAEALLKRIARTDGTSLDAYVGPLGELKTERGRIETLRSVRYTDRARLDAADARLAKAVIEVSTRAVDFLLTDDALASYLKDIAALEATAAALPTVAEARPVAEQADRLADGLDLLVQTVSSLAIDDSNRRTAILERISTVYAGLTKAKAVLAARRKELAAKEGGAAFAVQAQLLAQATANALGLCDTPERCDELTAKVMQQVEELEGRFGESDEHLSTLADRRAEIADAFAARRQQLLDERSKRVDALARGAERALATISKRAGEAKSLDDLNAYFAGDAMPAKVAATVKDLRALGASVRADDLAGKLKAAREDGLRRLRDRSELFDGEGAIRLGRHGFTVNRQALELTMVARPDADGRPRMWFHLAGTDYLSPVRDDSFTNTAALWDQDLESETAGVYRGEYLAWLILDAARAGRDGLDEASLRGAVAAAATNPAPLTTLVHGVASSRIELGIARGVHDSDAAAVLAALVRLDQACGLLRHPGTARAAAQIAWTAASGTQAGTGERTRAGRLALTARSLARLASRLGRTAAHDRLAADCADLVADHAPWTDAATRAQAGAYLADELGRAESPAFVRSAQARDLLTAFRAAIADPLDQDRLVRELAGLGDEPASAVALAEAWLSAFAARHRPELAAAVAEAAAELVAPALTRSDVSVSTAVTVGSLLGSHPRIRDGKMDLALDEVAARLDRHCRERVPAFRTYLDLRRRLVEAERARLRLDELAPKVLTSFVRNRLIDEVYLPFIGENLAKQIGATGANRRTDLMGMLLLVSPPGYGKTTLVEYLAQVLGLAYVKINGPALGHQATSLDPSAAPDAAARREVERVNLALAMGNNVLLYIDDIQHTNPEFLQKFISLCDGSRRIEGVEGGVSRTFDLRGKRFVVAMAGNPYTESGERFRIPDMLANRADTYNLGDVVGTNTDAFAQSFIENALTANPVMQTLVGRPKGDVGRFLRIAGGDDAARSELEHPSSAQEIADVSAVLRHLLRVRTTLLAVNAAYIASAAQSDDYRTEPPFKLQGSYRNMAKIAAKVVPALAADELDRLVVDHYRAEAQTLTTGAEANLLKLKELLGAQSADEAARWADIKRLFTRKRDLGGGEDPQRQAVAMLATVGERLGAVVGELSSARAAAERRAGASDDRLAGVLDQALGKVAEAMQASASAAEAARSAAPAMQPKIEVINTLPKYYAKLYEHHIHVIEQVLTPALELLASQAGSTVLARKNLERIASDLRGMIDKSRQAEQVRVEDERG